MFPFQHTQRKVRTALARSLRQRTPYGRSTLGPILVWTAVLLVVGLLVAGLVVLARSGRRRDGAAVAPVAETDWQRGKAGATVTLVEYADFQCPACKAYAPVVDAVYEAYKDRVLFAYRHFPLRTIHEFADLSARAAEAAGVQGKFWAMHDLLYENRSDWSLLPDERKARETFAAYANEIGLDVDRWQRDVDSAAVKDAVNADVASGSAAGVDGTPSYFLAGKRIENPRSVDAFKALVDAALANAPIASSTEEHVHEHADFRIVVNGNAVDLSDAQYMSTEQKALHPDVHLHNGNGGIVHTHAAGVTLGTFLSSLGMKLTDDCLTIPGSTLAPENGELCSGNGNVLVLMVNGKMVEEKSDAVIHDLDRILLSFGAEDQKKVEAYADAMPNDACIYSGSCPERGTPPDEECVGGLGTDCDL